MAGYKSTLFIEPIGDRLFRVVHHPLIYEAENGEVYTIPVWQMTDLASTWRKPLVSELYDGKAPMTACLHDWLYHTGIVSRKRADELFYEAMWHESEHYKSLGQYGIEDTVRLRMYQAVRDFGHSSYLGKPEDND